MRGDASAGNEPTRAAVSSKSSNPTRTAAERFQPAVWLRPINTMRVNNLLQSNQGSQVRYFRYDGLGRLTHQKLAEKSATLNDNGQYVGSGSWSDVAIYDNRSNVVSSIDARGVKRLSYFNNDPLNRLQSVSYDTSGFGDTASPITSAPNVNYTYRQRSGPSDLKDTTQRTSTVVAGFSTETYAFDGQSRVSESTLTLSSRPAFPMTVSYLYDSLDRNTQARYPKHYGVAGEPRRVVNQEFDAASRLSRLLVDNQEYEKISNIRGEPAKNRQGRTEQLKPDDRELLLQRADRTIGTANGHARRHFSDAESHLRLQKRQ